MKLRKICLKMLCFILILRVLSPISYVYNVSAASTDDTDTPNDPHNYHFCRCKSYDNYIFNDETLSMSRPSVLSRQNIRYLILLFDSIYNVHSGSDGTTDNGSDIVIDDIPEVPDTDQSATDKEDKDDGQNKDKDESLKPPASTTVGSNKIPQNDQNINSDKNNGKENKVNEDDLYWLARIIEAEAGNEPYEGKLAVGSVIINRVNSSDYPSTIYGVIFDNKYGVQFTPTVNGAIYNEPREESYKAAEEILKGNIYNKEILYFVNHEISNSKWFETKTFVFKIGRHSFYK